MIKVPRELPLPKIPGVSFRVVEENTVSKYGPPILLYGLEFWKLIGELGILEKIAFDEDL